jgi:hypothetical protein
VYDDDLATLDDWLRRLKVEYHIFFNGNRKKPPEDLRIRLERLFKKLSERSDMSPTQRFRFNTLITRYYVYRDRWRRTMSSREMGRERKTDTGPVSGGRFLSANPSAQAFRVSISDPKKEEEKILQLYDALLRIKRADTKDTPLSYLQFAKYVELQTRSIRERQHCVSVAFTIALEEDAIRFTAAAENPK